MLVSVGAFPRPVRCQDGIRGPAAYGRKLGTAAGGGNEPPDCPRMPVAGSGPTRDDRALVGARREQHVDLDESMEARAVVRSEVALGHGRRETISDVVVIDPRRMERSQTIEAAATIEQINRELRRDWSKATDGLETYRQILEIRPRQKAIIASGFSESKQVKAAQKMGAGSYLKKPYSFQKIGLAVKAELAK